MGRINTGGAKKRSGDNIATASSVSGTTLKLTPPKGYYDGSTALVTITDSDFVASNVKNGINLFGLAGNLVVKGNATGTTSSNGSGQLTISGLSFRPKVLILSLATTDVTNRQQTIAVFDTGFPFYNGNTGYAFGITNISGTITNYMINSTDNPITSSGAFLQNLIASKSYNWIAYE